MPTTRRQAALNKKGEVEPAEAGTKRSEQPSKPHRPPSKKRKAESKTQEEGNEASKERQVGTIERGHIYFWYRPKVELEEAHSLDDVKNMHMLLVPRPPSFATNQESVRQSANEGSGMNVLEPGAGAVPAQQTLDASQKRFRLITIGKKQLPEPEATSTGKRKEKFWATVVSVENDLKAVEQGLGKKTYDTKTRGTRHLEPARLAGRGAYAIVNDNPRIPSGAKTHLGYYLSHPSPENYGLVQESLGLAYAGSFVLQVKNPLTPAAGSQAIGLTSGKEAQYPQWILNEVFGKGSKGRESFGLRFTSCERSELLDYEGAELLLIAARSGEEGLEKSLGEGRGEALSQLGEKERKVTIGDVLRELALDEDTFPAAALQGEWI